MRHRITIAGAAAILVMALAPAAIGAPSTCNGLPVDIVAAGDGEVTMGTSGDDVIVGTAGDDTIDGRGGADTICGLGGADVIYGGGGDDWINGGQGTDLLSGSRGDDTLVGGPGNDRLDGGFGKDLLVGGSGKDTLQGGRDDDTLEGGAGADRLYGRAGADSLDGGDADDFLDGGSGDDTLLGGSGGDRIWGKGGADVLRGGEDSDLLRAGFGIDECAGELLISCEMTEVSPGDRGKQVTYLQRRLTEALLYRGGATGVYPVDDPDLPGRMTAAVYAFHKLHQDPSGNRWTAGDHVSADWTLDDWHLLQTFTPTAPVGRSGEPNRIEVDARHEVMWLIRNGKPAGIFHVSIGGEYRYSYRGEWRLAHTPRGHFDIDRYAPGRKTAGYQYKSWYFEQNYFAVHGFFKVPPYPASHGCVRVIYEDADWLTARLEVGWPIHVWDE